MPEYIEREKAIKNISQIRVEVVGARATILAEALRSYRDAVLKALNEIPTTDVENAIEEFRQKVNAKIKKYNMFGKEYIQRIMREVQKEMKGE